MSVAVSYAGINSFSPSKTAVFHDRGTLSTNEPKKLRQVLIINNRIDGSTDRCGIAIVTNQRALLSGSDQPERKLGRLRIFVGQAGKETCEDRHICTMVYGALLGTSVKNSKCSYSYETRLFG